MTALKRVLKLLETAFVEISEIDEINRTEIKDVVDVISFCASIMNKAGELKVKEE